MVAVLPHIAKKSCFALKGGTAINLFVRDMPRLSVDIDLQYIHFDGRESAFANINNALRAIADSLNHIKIQTSIRQGEEDICKMVCFNEFASIKIEPNYVIRGCIAPPKLMQTTLKVQESYGFAAISVLSFGELYGGKICAALDRQHPRDLFDIKYLLENEGITTEVKNGFIVSLLSHNRPPHEILKPNVQSQEAIFSKEFTGMTKEKFSYKDHLSVIHQLIDEVTSVFSKTDKDFLISFFNAKPYWNLIEIEKLNELPAIKWKLKNLESLKNKNIEKFDSQLKFLENMLVK